MASSLLLHKRIETTLAKAKELRKFVEPLITKSKNDTTHSRRIAFSYLQNKESTKVLFGEVAEKVANRPGGYTRIIKLANRLGDNAETCIIELVDYNETLLKPAPEKAKTRRSRRGSGKKASVTADKPVDTAGKTATQTKAEPETDKQEE
jgi:large subunit ribosomal protein L17